MDDLSYIINKSNTPEMIKRMGTEKEKKQGDFIFIESDFATRVLLEKDDKIVAGLHFVKFGDRKVIAGIHTEPEYRRQGLMTKIFNKAISKYGNIEHNDNQTPEGSSFIKSLDKNNNKHNKNKPTL